MTLDMPTIFSEKIRMLAKRPIFYVVTPSRLVVVVVGSRTSIFTGGLMSESASEPASELLATGIFNIKIYRLVRAPSATTRTNSLQFRTSLQPPGS